MDTRKKVEQWLKEGVPKSQIARNLGMPRSTLYDMIDRWNRPPKPEKEQEEEVIRPPAEQVRVDRALERAKKDKTVTAKKYKVAIEQIERLKGQVEAVQQLKNKPSAFEIKPAKRQKGEATVVALASDWHIEEEQTLAQTSGLGEYNLEISRKRAEQYFSVLLRLIKIEQVETPINHLVLALLGDFISSDIHEDTAKSALLEPIDAIIRCREYLVSGIRFLLENSDLKITAVCHSGNHGRKDKNMLIANEAGNSLEFLMYHFLASDFADEPRIEFIIPEGYHSYLKIYDTTVRFHHGHAIRYGGGVGGITIPVNKAIANWNDGHKADIDCFGHFHQMLDGETFICNGSMIGYSAYALFVKAKFQEPRQVMFGIHSELGKYFTRPILFT
jgi:transposase